jgi:hypothetical protein
VYQPVSPAEHFAGQHLHRTAPLVENMTPVCASSSAWPPTALSSTCCGACGCCRLAAGFLQADDSSNVVYYHSYQKKFSHVLLKLAQQQCGLSGAHARQLYNDSK